MAVRWLMVVLLVLASCGRDTVKDDPSSGEDCPDGERWNPILATCEADGANVVSNNSANNGGTNNADNVAPNNVTPNNGTTNNVTPNNSTNNASNNNTIPPNNTMMTCGVGNLIGKTCAPSGEPLAAADVTISGIDCATGMPFEMTTRTMSDGTFEFMGVPSGQHELRVQTGSFNSMRQVLIQADLTTDLTSAADKVCLDQNVNIAVITGAYDHVEGILGTLNLTFDTVGSDALGDPQAETFLTNLQAMNSYDIIFINCGDLFDNTSLLDFTGQTIAAMANNLRAYVQGGKSLYVSDWSAPFIERAFPEMIEFLGDDTNHNDARMGYAPQTIVSNVLTPELQGVLGRADAAIEFPQDTAAGIINNNWAVAEGVGPNSTIQIEGDAVLCGPGGGLGNPCPMNGSTQAGAPLLVTYKDPSGGTVVYTSFHNERQTTLNQDMELILRFLIFQL